MTPGFDAYEFLRRFDAGELDANLSEEIECLSPDQVEQVALVLANKLRTKSVGGSN